MAFGEDALGPNVPVGGKMGAQENPELHTYDGDYRGSPQKGDTLLPESVSLLGERERREGEGERESERERGKALLTMVEGYVPFQHTFIAVFVITT